MGKRILLLAGVLALAGGAAYAVHARSGPEAPPARPVAVATAEVVKTDLSDYWSESGTVGFRGQRTLRGVQAGVLTWLPRPGRTISRGGTLYRVGDRPVALFYGSSPMFRDIGTVGMVGRDVKVLAANLRALGYRIGPQPSPGTTVTTVTTVTTGVPTVVTAQDGVFTAALQAAVKRWQAAIGVRPATGILARGDVLVLPGAVRVGAAAAQLGDDATGNLMAVSDQAKAVTVVIDAGRADDLKAGQKVRITLPDSTAAGGTISSVSSNIQADAEGADGPKVRVVVAVDDASAIKNVSSADVDVRFTGTTRRNVLAVPVGALLALRGGGYGVQVSGGALTAVKVGLFADGMVQIDGTGIAAGTRVVTTS
ncbi:efflux RND transporter periplasmic adaptor subunit [Paractinoplanes durhamensis]|uniref:Peptidoglycan-binding protein n=1 Tax=Paractinoplanes durhamensis TaxID=113563 RepID=A0ABQ3Z7B0_9ACTN|nr:efflux RND transporter periplasmic adaptor subunit [Actinoplanes durhamensis]GIE05724.1 peptidoglycan-binding protein [Actinoplanes durhamensis]